MMALKLIKRIAKFADNIRLEKELNNITSQVVHKNDVLTKNNVTKTIEYDGTGTLKITTENGKITNIVIEG